jgi:hypothetical protein
MDTLTCFQRQWHRGNRIILVRNNIRSAENSLWLVRTFHFRSTLSANIAPGFPHLPDALLFEEDADAYEKTTPAGTRTFAGNL